MPIDDTLNAGINLNIQAGGAGSVQDMSARLRNMKDALAITKKELQEAGLRGSDFMKATLDATNAVRNANEQAKAYNTALRQFGPNSVAASQALKSLRSSISDVAAESQALQGRLKSVHAESESFWGKISSTGVASLAKWAAGIFSVYTAFNYLKNAVNQAVEFDSKLDKLAVSGQRFGLSFQEASKRMYDLAFDVSRTGGYDINGNAGAQSSFAADQVVEAMTKLRDRGVDVFHMTKGQLIPALDAAKATAQDLAATTDAMGLAMEQFNLKATETARVADVMVGAFQASGLTAEEFSDGISKAGAVARQSGTSLEEYTAVLVRMKQLGMDGGGFQKLFFGALSAPSAKQLKALSDAGINPFIGSDLDSAVQYASRKASEDVSGISLSSAVRDPLGAARSALAAANNLGRIQEIQAGAKAVEDQKDKIVALATEQEKLNGQEQTFTSIISIQKEKLDELKEAQGAWKDKLTATNAALADVKTKFDQLSDPRIAGMASYDTKIAQAELALKRQQLALIQNANGTRFYEERIRSLTDEMKDQERALDGMRKRYDEVGRSLDRAKAKAGEYEAKLASLRNTELAGEGAFGDAQFALQQRINQLQLKKSQLSPVDLFGANQIDAQIAQLQKQLEQSRLQQSVTFDPQRRMVEKAAEQADIRSGKKAAPGNAEDIVEKIDSYAAKLERENRHVKSLTREHRREAAAIAEKSQEIAGLKTSIDDAREAMDALSESTKAAEDALNALKLEKEVEFGEQVFQLKERYREWREELGLIAKEKPYDQLMQDMDSLGTKYGALQATRDIEQQKVDEYQKMIDEGSLSLSFYERRLEDVKTANERLGKELDAEVERFEAMPKYLRPQLEILEEWATKVGTVGDQYDFLGKKGGAMMVALLGENGENAGKLREIASALGSSGTAASAAAGSSMGATDAIEAFETKLRNFNIEFGTTVADKMGSLVDALNGLDTTIRSIADLPAKAASFTPLGPVAKAAGSASGGDWGSAAAEAGLILIDPLNMRSWIPGRANGGVVPGYGYNDSELALLTPGERVLTKRENRAYESGMGGVTVNIAGPVSVRSDQDITRLARAISKELHQEVRRVRSGQPA